MAKINGLAATNITGSAGKLTFTVVNGQNIMKQKASVVKNPRTVNQQSQRMKFNTLTNAYARVQQIADHSFVGIGYGSQSMNFFKKRNSATISNGTSFAAKQTNIIPFGINGILVSKGSLPSSTVEFEGYLGNQLTIPHMYIGGDVKVTTATTVVQLCNYLGIAKGQQFTYLGVGCGGQGTSELITIGANKVQPIRQRTAAASFVIKEDALDATPAFVATDEAGIFNLNPAIIDLENSQDFGKFVFDTTSEMTNCTQILHDDLLNATDYEAAIISEKINGVWERSTSYLHPVYNSAIKLSVQLPLVLAFDAATVIETYNPSSPYYLNKATL